MHEVIENLVKSLGTASDQTIERAAAKLDKLRTLTAGRDREVVLWALAECRDLLEPAGRLRRALALAIIQNEKAPASVAG